MEDINSIQILYAELKKHRGSIGEIADKAGVTSQRVSQIFSSSTITDRSKEVILIAKQVLDSRKAEVKKLMDEIQDTVTDEQE
jgi:hypothetical protein